VLSPVDNETMYAGRSVIYKSVNSGNSWAATNTSAQFSDNPALTMDVSSTSTEVVYVATMPWYGRSQLFKTINGGDEWVDMTGGLPDRIITDIHVDVIDHDLVFVTLGGFEASHLYKTTNGGGSWIDIGASLPDIPGWSVVNDPVYPGIIYFGNEFGVYVSYDDGESWAEFIDGMGDGVFAMDLKISPSNNKLRVATHGNGVFERSLEVISNVVDVDSEGEDFGLINYPNPFITQTTISFKLTDKAKVNISVFDVTGKLLDVPINSMLNKGHHQISWKIKDGVSNNGVYLCRLNVDGRSQSIKMRVK